MPNPLRRPAFAWFFAGRFTSMLGSSMAPIALAFAVLGASQDATDLGFVLAANVTPHLLFLLLGGATADRFARRTVLVAANVGSAVTQAGVAVVLLTGHYSLPLVAGFELANGVLAAFTTPALRGVVPEIVESDQLQKANALLGAARSASRILGPTVAAVVVAAAGGGPAIAFDAATFAVAALCLLRLPGSVRPARSGPSLRHDIRDGWCYFRTVRWLWPISLAFSVVNLASTGSWQILGPQVSGPATWGLLLSARAVGLLISSALMYRLEVRHYLRVTVFAALLASAPLLGLGIGLPPIGLVIVAVIGGSGSSVSAVTWDSALQAHIPAAKLSRVASIDDLLSFAAIPAGQLAVGPLAAAFGARTVCVLSAAIAMTVVVLPLCSRAVRDPDLGAAAVLR